MMKVASGLDSLVLGEPQILGQMKSAYAAATEAGSMDSRLHATFHKVFTVAKRVRSETAIGENPVSVAYAAVTLAQQIFSNLKNDTVLLIGAGETIELVARHLAEQGLQKMIVANRTLTNAVALAQKFSGQAILLADIPEYLPKADIVISLYTVDDLREVIDENMRSREQAAKIAEEIVDDGVTHFERELASLGVVETVKAFRQSIETVRDAELAKALRALETGVDPSEALSQLGRSLANKIMHKPTLHLRKASMRGDMELIKATQLLFELEVAEEQEPSAPALKSENE